MSPHPPKVYTVDTAPVEVLRSWYKDLHARHLDGKDDRHLGWWVAHNATEVTLTLPNGDTITAAGSFILTAIREYEDNEQRESARRAA